MDNILPIEWFSRIMLWVVSWKSMVEENISYRYQCRHIHIFRVLPSVSIEVRRAGRRGNSRGLSPIIRRKVVILRTDACVHSWASSWCVDGPWAGDVENLNVSQVTSLCSTTKAGGVWTNHLGRYAGYLSEEEFMKVSTDFNQFIFDSGAGSHLGFFCVATYSTPFA